MTIQTNVIRRGAVYYHRVRIPSDLVEISGRKEIWRSLGTRCHLKAKLRGHVASVAVAQAFETVRRHINMITKNQISQIVRDFYVRLLDEDELDRVSMKIGIDWKSNEDARDHLEHLGDTDEEIDAAIADSGLTVEDLIKDSRDVNEGDLYETVLKSRNWHDMAEFAEDLIRDTDLAADPDTPEYRQLCLYAIRAMAEAKKVSVARAQGDWAAASNDPLFLNLPSPHTAATGSSRHQVINSPPMGELLEGFLREKSFLSEKYISEFKISVEWLQQYFGVDKPISAYTPTDIVDYKNILMKTPANFRKFFPGATITEAIKLNEIANRPTLGPTSINNKRLGNVDTFFAWAARNHHIDENPVKGIRVEVRKKRQGGLRDPFSADQLQQIFNAPHFAGCLSSTSWKVAGDYKIRDHRYWLPLLALWTGGRLGELAQLLVSDVNQVDGIWMVSITDAEDENGEDHGKRIKNLESERDVPVHPGLIKAGFIDYLNKQKRAGNNRIFPLCNLGADGSYSPFSKHFRRFLDSIGIKKRNRTVFHSFRHTFEDAMREAGLEDSIRYRLTGRSLRHSSEEYGHGYSASRLAKEIEKIRYPGLVFSELT